MAKTVFIAHTISDDVEANLKKVDIICAKISSPDLIPIFPSHTWRRYLSTPSDEDKSAKYWGGLVNDEYFKRGMVDEVWVYGDKITEGMAKEIKLAQAYGIPVVAKNDALKSELENI